jgi:inorganic pyrophosphatase
MPNVLIIRQYRTLLTRHNYYPQFSLIIPAIMKLDKLGKSKKTVNIIIETPKGCRSKYAWDPDRKLFKLKKLLPLGAVFPFDFGFVPGTKGEDGDPLDVLVIMDEPAYPGVLVTCFVVGVLEATQTEGKKTVRNDRLIGVAAASTLHKDLRTLNNLNYNLRDEIEHFFISYNKQEGKKFKPLGWENEKHALKLIAKAGI